MTKITMLDECSERGQLVDYYCVSNSPLTKRNFVKLTIVTGMWHTFCVYRYFKTAEGLARFRAILDRLRYFIVEIEAQEYSSHEFVYKLLKKITPIRYPGTDPTDYSTLNFIRHPWKATEHPLEELTPRRYVEGYVPITRRHPATTREEAEWKYHVLGMHVYPQNFWTPKYREMLDGRGILETAERIVTKFDLGEDW